MNANSNYSTKILRKKIHLSKQSFLCPSDGFDHFKVQFRTAHNKLKNMWSNISFEWWKISQNEPGYSGGHFGSNLQFGWKSPSWPGGQGILTHSPSLLRWSETKLYPIVLFILLKFNNIKSKVQNLLTTYDVVGMLVEVYGNLDRRQSNQDRYRMEELDNLASNLWRIFNIDKYHSKFSNLHKERKLKQNMLITIFNVNNMRNI